MVEFTYQLLYIVFHPHSLFPLCLMPTCVFDMGLGALLESAWSISAYICQPKVHQYRRLIYVRHMKTNFSHNIEDSAIHLLRPTLRGDAMNRNQGELKFSPYTWRKICILLELCTTSILMLALPLPKLVWIDSLRSDSGGPGLSITTHLSSVFAQGTHYHICLIKKLKGHMHFGQS